jgi:hypothetical protein
MPRPDKLTERRHKDETKGPPARNSRSSSWPTTFSLFLACPGMSDKPPRRGLIVMLRHRMCRFPIPNQPDARLPKHAPSLQTCFIAVWRHLSRQANRLGICRGKICVSSFIVSELFVRPVRHFSHSASRRRQGRMADDRPVGKSNFSTLCFGTMA